MNRSVSILSVFLGASLLTCIRVRGTSDSSGALIFNVSVTISCEPGDASRQSMFEPLSEIDKEEGQC